MLFSVGVEMPKNENEAYGLVVPALCRDNYGCISAADTLNDIPAMVKDVISMVLADMSESGVDTVSIVDEGFAVYQKQDDYQYCDTWLLIDVDISDYLGKHQRVNITVPDYLLKRIDQKVGSTGEYKSRSHFLTVAAQRELSV
ncbi:type II toxin-antitoxin system HicB family antitoxin [Cardiobacteriaceae bacterium TAE3-ERU3]|nr:type II toxin-antitoxin system HicB family antitoxin [Cardiobacteriaceae bacterium TAE3-ERU3]